MRADSPHYVSSHHATLLAWLVDAGFSPPPLSYVLSVPPWLRFLPHLLPDFHFLPPVDYV